MLTAAEAIKNGTCLTCRFAVEFKHPQIVGQGHIECWRNPPCFMLLPVPGPNGAVGMSPMFAHIQVQANAGCFQHESSSIFYGEED